MNFNKNIITLGLVGLLIAPAQNLKAEAPAWLKACGPVAGMAALGAAASYGLCKAFSQREAADAGFVAPTSPLKRTITWAQAHAAKQENNSLQRELDSDPSSQLMLKGWARRSGNVQKMETYRKECEPRALTHDEQKKLHEVEVKMPMFTSRANVALFSSALFGIAGFLTSRQTKTGVPFFVAAGVTALANWFLENGKKQEYSAQLKPLEDKIEKYMQEGPARQANFARMLGSSKEFNEIKNLIENGDIDSARLIVLQITNNRKITLSPLAFAIAAGRQDLQELLEKDYYRTCAWASSPEDYRDLVYFCSETGDLQALQRLLSSWQFSACPDRSDIIQEAYNKALQNKQYHLLELLDHSPDKQKAKDYFASLIDMFDMLEDAQKYMLEKVPLFNLIRNDYTEEIRELLRSNNFQNALEIFCQKHIDSLAHHARPLILQMKKKLDSEADNKNQTEATD